MKLFQKPSAPDTGAASEPIQVERSHLPIVETQLAGLGPGAVAIPSEEVTLVRVPLPLSTHRQRQAAAGFAVEDMIAEPLDMVHVSLGPELASGEYLVAVVRRAKIEAWAAKIGPARNRLVPDVMVLPIPAPGSISVREVLGRVLVRRANGTGFATQADAFETFWRAEGTPQIVLFGGRLPEGLPVSATGLMPVTANPEALAFDLMQGQWRQGLGDGRKLALRLAAVLAVTLVAQIGILAAKTVALQRIAVEREAALYSQLLARVPGLPKDAPLDLALRRAMPPGQEAASSGFIPLAARVSEALLPKVGSISVRNMVFTAEDGTLAILVEGPDLATLQDVENNLAGAGLAAAPGVATTGDGTAEVRYVIGAKGG